MNVTQVVSAAGPVDAVTNQALAWRQQFRRWGWRGRDFSIRIPRGMRRKQMRSLGGFDPPEGLLVIHFSGYAPGLERLFDSRARTLLLYHNVTPEEWFWPTEPVEAVGCRLGREQLKELAAAADSLAGVSEFNAQELRAISGRPAGVIPVLFDRGQLPAAQPDNGPQPAAGSSGPTILFVGRLTPHKRQDLIIRAFAEYRRREPGARLVLVGGAVSLAFGQALARLAERLAPGAVSIESGLSANDLAARYRTADIFLCLSEHEGFCIPVLEAFHFGVPVVARRAGAVPEVVGDAGVLLSDEDDVITIAELLDVVAGDPELREKLRRRGELRLAHFDPAVTAERMHQTLGALTH